MEGTDKEKGEAVQYIFVETFINWKLYNLLLFLWNISQHEQVNTRKSMDVDLTSYIFKYCVFHVKFSDKHLIFDGLFI